MFVAMDIEAAVIKAGHKVVGFAGTAERAVTLADEMRPDLVLMDIRLPGDRDGVDAAIEIRQRFDIPSLHYQRRTRMLKPARAPRPPAPWASLPSPSITRCWRWR